MRRGCAAFVSLQDEFRHSRPAFKGHCIRYKNRSGPSGDFIFDCAHKRPISLPTVHVWTWIKPSETSLWENGEGNLCTTNKECVTGKVQVWGGKDSKVHAHDNKSRASKKWFTNRGGAKGVCVCTIVERKLPSKHGVYRVVPLGPRGTALRWPPACVGTAYRASHPASSTFFRADLIWVQK